MRKVAQLSFDPIVDGKRKRSGVAGARRPKALETKISGGWMETEHYRTADEDDWGDTTQDELEGMPEPQSQMAQLDHGERVDILVRTPGGDVIGMAEGTVKIGFDDRVVNGATITVRIQTIKIA